MASNDYIPTTDADLYNFGLNFQAKINSAETSFGLVAGDTTALSDLNSAFNTELGQYNTAKAAAAVASEEKKAARIALVNKLRELTRRVQAYPALTDAQRAALGIPIRDTVPTSISAPTTAPILTVDFSQRGQHAIKFADTATPTSSAKPSGAVGLKLYRKIADTQPAGVEAMELYGILSRSGEVIVYAEAQYGSQVFYLGQWVTQKGLVSPISDFTNATIVK